MDGGGLAAAGPGRGAAGQRTGADPACGALPADDHGAPARRGPACRPAGAGAEPGKAKARRPAPAALLGGGSADSSGTARHSGENAGRHGGSRPVPYGNGAGAGPVAGGGRRAHRTRAERADGAPGASSRRTAVSGPEPGRPEPAHAGAGAGGAGRGAGAAGRLGV